jgi:hypothetical protein
MAREAPSKQIDQACALTSIVFGSERGPGTSMAKLIGPALIWSNASRVKIEK